MMHLMHISILSENFAAIGLRKIQTFYWQLTCVIQIKGKEFFYKNIPSRFSHRKLFLEKNIGSQEPHGAMSGHKNLRLRSISIEYKLVQNNFENFILPRRKIGSQFTSIPVTNLNYTVSCCSDGIQVRWAHERPNRNIQWSSIT